MSKTIIIILVILAISLVFVFSVKKEQKKASRPGMIKYVALGDSYTIGSGVAESETWPVLLTQHLQASGLDIELMANPARNGWNTQDVIVRELPVLDRAEPDFVTLLIGTNDWAQGVSQATFQKNLVAIIDHVQEKLPHPNRLLLLTTPDYSVTPIGATYGDPKATAAGITRFNAIIKQEAKKRGLTVVDIFPISQKMKGQPNLVAADGLHPSGEAYILWEAAIYPEALKLLKPE